MKYSEVIKLLEEEGILVSTEAVRDIFFSHLSYNSLDVKRKTLFFCKGFNYKEEYLYEAIKKGAICYISEKVYNVAIPGIIVTDIRKAVAVIANKFFNIDKLFKIGITGTKGKTTTVYFLRNIFDAWQKKKTAYISTIDYFTGGSYGKSYNTTPDSLELLRMFQKIKRKNLKHVIMEVSSQAVKLDRIYGIDFNVGAFLNISSDHISPFEHKNFNDYLDCKITFLKSCSKIFLFHETNKYNYIIKQLKGKNIITFGFDKDCNYRINKVYKNNQKTIFEVENKHSIEKYETSMIGKFNLINACCAIAIAKELRIPYKCIYEGILKTKVPGRMMSYYLGDIPIIVDYAHNKLSIKTLFTSLKKEYPSCNLKVVVGCPGDKAYNRRKEIGTLCNKYASYIYLTSDDPGMENVVDICKEIATHITKSKYEIIEDRETAIIKAMKNLQKNDILAIIGKGHEDYNFVGNEYLEYKSDSKVVEEVLKQVGGNNGKTYN